MFESCNDFKLTPVRASCTGWRPWLYLMVSGIVTVLLLAGALTGAVRGADANGIDPCLFEFASEFFTAMGRYHLDGFMACKESQYRIAVYWIEPAILRDMSIYLRYSDFIFTRRAVHYWTHGASQPAVYHRSGSRDDSLLPEGASVESAVRSALAILNRIRSGPTTKVPLQIAKFFEHSRDRAQYSHEVLPDEPDRDKPPSARASDVQLLNALPYGREYVKYTRKDGVLEWGARRALNKQPVVRLTVKPISSAETDDTGSMFDPNTLGRWTLIPDSYRAYWSFDQAYRQLKDVPDPCAPGRALADKLESYLGNNAMPAHLWRALNRLWFKTTLTTGETPRISRSAQAAVRALCEDGSVSKYHTLRELSSMAGQIQKYKIEQADDLVRPLIAPVLKHVGSETPRCLKRVMPAITVNKWFAYGSLLLDEARRQGLVADDVAEALAAQLETARLASERPPYEPSEASATVRQYLAQIDADPARGDLTTGDIGDILEKGLEKPCADARLASRDEVIENTIRSIRLIAGEGPFRGDRAKLVESIERFSRIYLAVNKTREPIDTVLATFLALSFCDISTAEDHDVLISQFGKLSAEFQSLSNSMLAERELSSLIDQNDVQGMFSPCEKMFGRYVDDPLWPAFKFPLTANEETRIVNKVKQRFTQLEPLLDEVSDMVKYGGANKMLKSKTVFGLSGAAQSLLSVTASIRRPSYPGVSCQYQGKYGFAAVIRGPLYRNGNRPKEKFKVMKYFHMGHRLEEIVKRERDLARP